jgi:hypothetical protein
VTCFGRGRSRWIHLRQLFFKSARCGSISPHFFRTDPSAVPFLSVFACEPSLLIHFHQLFSVSPARGSIFANSFSKSPILVPFFVRQIRQEIAAGSFLTCRFVKRAVFAFLVPKSSLFSILADTYCWLRNPEVAVTQCHFKK